METSAQVGASAYFGDALYESQAVLESAIDAAVHAVCKSINHIGKVAFGIASESTASRYALPPEEACAVSRIPSIRRRASWRSGRAAARMALEKLGKAGAAVGRGEAGEPIWPHGTGGSITHCSPWSIAAAIESTSSIFLGIDLENTNRLQECEIETVVCRPAERKWLHEGGNALERLCMIFSAKEALYKSLFPSYGRYIDFVEVELSWCAEACGFNVLVAPTTDSGHRRASLIASRRCNNLIFSCAAYELQ